MNVIASPLPLAGAVTGDAPVTEATPIADAIGATASDSFAALLAALAPQPDTLPDGDVTAASLSSEDADEPGVTDDSCAGIDLTALTFFMNISAPAPTVSTTPADPTHAGDTNVGSKVVDPATTVAAPTAALTATTDPIPYCPAPGVGLDEANATSVLESAKAKVPTSDADSGTAPIASAMDAAPAELSVDHASAPTDSTSLPARPTMPERAEVSDPTADPATAPMVPAPATAAMPARDRSGSVDATHESKQTESQNIHAVTAPTHRHTDATVSVAAPESAPASARVVTEQLVRAIEPMRHRGDGNYELTLELRPHELGRVELRLQLHDGILGVHIVAERAETQRLLQDQLSQLRDLLQARGVATGSLDVGDNAARHSMQQPGSGANDASHDRRDAPADRAETAAPAAVTVAAAPTRPAVRSSERLLDIHA